MGLRTRHRGEHPRRLRAPAADQGGYAPAQAHPYREGRWVHDPVGGRRVKRISIGLRLTLWYLVIFALAQALFGVGMWYILRQNLRDIADRTLENTTEDVRRFLRHDPGEKACRSCRKRLPTNTAAKPAATTCRSPIPTATGSIARPRSPSRAWPRLRPHCSKSAGARTCALAKNPSACWPRRSTPADGPTSCRSARPWTKKRKRCSSSATTC